MVAPPQKRRARRIFVECKGTFKAYLCRHPIVVQYDFNQYELLLLATAQSEGVINHERLKELLPMHPADITKVLQKLRRDGLLTVEGRGRGCVYHLNDGGEASEQMMQATKRKLSAQETERLVCCFCTEWRTAQEIADYLHRTKDHVRNVILPRLLKQGVLEQRFSVKRHPNQQYRAGREE